jgi:YgiT-type zinc finger domain-containing protein
MTEDETCPVCEGPTAVTTIPVRVERGGREVLRLLVPARECGRCGHVAIDDEVTEAVVESLEEHTRPGDDIIFPGGATLH